MNRSIQLYKFGGLRFYCSSTPIIKPNKLFSSLFPTQTSINPMKEQIYSFEAIENGTSSPKGTTFKNSLDQQPFSPTGANVDHNKSFLYDEDGRIRIEEEEEELEEDDEMFMMRDEEEERFSLDFTSEAFGDSLRRHGRKQSLQLYSTKKASLISKEKAYINFLEKHQSNPNLLSFLVQSAKSDSDKVFEIIKKTLGFEFSESNCHQVPDNSLYGRTVSTVVSIVPNENETINVESIYKSFSTFGVTLNGVRLKVLNASKLKTISMFGLDNNLQEDYFREYLSETFDPKMKDPKFCRITFSSKVYKAHKIGDNAHSGVAHLTFDSHLMAMKAIKSLSNSTIAGWVGLSRYAHSEGSAAADLITILERRRHRQMDDIKLMKDIIDLKTRVRELEGEVKKYEDSMKKGSNKKNYLNNSQ
ncbi:hypothetical protein ACTFIU_006438 [Dictyostelium citrinum]